MYDQTFYTDLSISAVAGDTIPGFFRSVPRVGAHPGYTDLSTRNIIVSVSDRDISINSCSPFSHHRSLTGFSQIVLRYSNIPHFCV